MPLPGGPSDKIPNRYEDWWTVFCMIDVMAEDADSIRLEVPGIDAFEFWLKKKGIYEYHQVKRQYGKSGRWTLSELESETVLSNFWNRLQEPQARCIFVSTQAAFQLDELADRARGANSWGEFDKAFLKAKDIRKAFEVLCQKWSKCSRVEAYEALKRIRVETISEYTLRGFVRSRLKALVDAEPDNVSACLTQYAHDEIHHELFADDIWNHLQEQGFQRRQWNNNPHVWASVEEQNERYLSRLQREIIIPDKIIPRDEVQTIVHDLTSDNEKRGVMISGEAGIGKSSVILQVMQELQHQNYPILAFRIDVLNVTPSPKEVGRQLDIPESPACVLVSIANGRECILVIDQLDAVSKISGRTPHFFECIHAIINDAQAHRNMRVLLACRKFDLDNDERFRQLLSEENAISHIPITPLPSEKVIEAVAQLGLDATQLQIRQTEILSVPLHLKLLSEIIKETKIRRVEFRTVNELYGRFWEDKQWRIRKRLGHACKWTDVIDRLCDYMSQQQEQDLFVPADILDEFQEDADAMVTEHVLIKDNRTYYFFHHSFFDYAFARRFFARGYRLMDWLQTDEQHLFRRSQVRQILIYGCGQQSQYSRHVDGLRRVLFSKNVRFHIKHLVFALLKQLSDPTEEEWEILFSLLTDDSYGLSGWAWYVIANSEVWFQLLDEQLDLISTWLRGQDEEWVQSAFFLLARVQRYFPDRCAELVEPYVGTSERWNERLIQLMQAGDIGAGRRFFDLFLRLIDEGILDDVKRQPHISHRDFWDFFFSLSKEHADWTCEAIRHYLERQILLNRAADNTRLIERHFIPESQSSNQIILESARRSPITFISEILPLMLHVIALTPDRQDSSGVRYDSVWQYRSHREKYETMPTMDMREDLLAGMEIAMRKVATENPEAFRQITRPLHALNFETIHYLLIRAYTANGQVFADEAAEYLYSLPARLRTGYRFPQEKSAPYWATRQLLEAITPHCSDESLKKLEGAILNYYSDWERDVAGHKDRGFGQFVLLEGITSARRSFEVSQRLGQWQRKFDMQTVKPLAYQSFFLSEVPSPISQEAASKMTDEQWLNAIAKYDYEDSQITSDYNLMGGAHELGRILREEVKNDPERFANLVLTFPDTTNVYYFDAVLWGIQDTSVDANTALKVCMRCHQLPGRPCGRTISYVLSKGKEFPFSKDVVEMVSWYATEDPDPAPEQETTLDLLNHGINTARGSAAEAMATLIFFEKEYFGHFLPILQKMVHDPALSVKACVAHTLAVVLKYDREVAVELFQELCKTEESLLQTHYVEEFLYYALPTHFQNLSTLLERMLSSPLPEVAQTGARRTCLLALTLEEARPFAERCLAGTEHQRLGASKIFSANLLSARFRSYCKNALVQLFNDPNEEVRTEAATCFHAFKGQQLGDYIPLVEAFVHSEAFKTKPRFFIEALQETTAKLPDITCNVCEHFVHVMESESSDKRPDSLDTQTISQLLFRLYSQSNDEHMKSRCLDMIDRMLYLNWYGVHDVLKQYER